MEVMDCTLWFLINFDHQQCLYVVFMNVGEALMEVMMTNKF
jgi:hypothetical protein